MNTTPHSFIDIFNPKTDGDESVPVERIVIPPIQRDYAQGRLDKDVERVRNRFLDALKEAVTVTGKPITLDFVYGEIDAEGTMTPLDGQQRLTTLFLLHWYAAKKENIAEDRYAFLKRFRYETRYSARSFCEELIGFTPSFEIPLSLSKDIENQSWFLFDWKNDPTIQSMLVMLDAINGKFRKIPDVWSRLEKITFYFLPIKDMGLTDDLYIKMNSRGKPLTLFEHFKAELEREIRKLEENRKLEKNTTVHIIKNIDKKWTDLLWSYCKDGNADGKIVDDMFLNYFRFICDIICYRNGESPQKNRGDIFDLLHQYFSIEKNIEAFETFFDCWCDIEGYNTPKSFLDSFIMCRSQLDCSYDPTKKIVVDGNVDIFKDCICKDDFPLNRKILLYAITVYLQHRTKISRPDFIRRIRIVNNLIQNSENEIRTDRISAIIKVVDAIILKGKFDCTENSFNANQIEEEKQKEEFLAHHSELAEAVFKLEDHEILKGQISIVWLPDEKLQGDGAELGAKLLVEHGPRFIAEYGRRFASLFCCKGDKIDCALMAKGDYGQREKNGRYQYASRDNLQTWRDLFHKSNNISGFENTKSILLKLLESNSDFNDSKLDEIIKSFTDKCENEKLFPWSYYYVKYDVFRPLSGYGKFHKEADKTRYLFLVMQTQCNESSSSYMPYLKAADEKNLDTESHGRRLRYKDKYITCENDAYVIQKEGDSEVERLSILQNADGIDTEDRIEKLKNYINPPKPSENESTN